MVHVFCCSGWIVTLSTFSNSVIVGIIMLIVTLMFTTLAVIDMVMLMRVSIELEWGRNVGSFHIEMCVFLKILIL